MSKGLGGLPGRYDGKSWTLKDGKQFANRRVHQSGRGGLGERAQLAQMTQPAEFSSVWLKHKVGQGRRKGKEGRLVRSLGASSGASQAKLPGTPLSCELTASFIL